MNRQTPSPSENPNPIIRPLYSGISTSTQALLALLVLLASVSDSAFAASKPNVILVMTDDI